MVIQASCGRINTSVGAFAGTGFVLSATLYFGITRTARDKRLYEPVVASAAIAATKISLLMVSSCVVDVRQP